MTTNHPNISSPLTFDTATVSGHSVPATSIPLRCYSALASLVLILPFIPGKNDVRSNSPEKKVIVIYPFRKDAWY